MNGGAIYPLERLFILKKKKYISMIGTIEKQYLLKEIELNDSITCLNHNTFSHCMSLTKIHLPTSLKRIEYECFMNCKSLEHIEIPTTVTFLGDKCFYDCSNFF